MNREDVRKFLLNQQDSSKEEVLANFVSLAVINGLPIEKIGKAISDLKSYPEWKWGD